MHRWIPFLLLCSALVGVPATAGPMFTPAEEVLPNGIRLVHQSWSGPELGDQVLCSFAFEGGVIEESAAQRGLTNVLAQTLSRAIAERLRAPGDPAPPVVGVALDAEYLGIQLLTSRERFSTNWPVALNLLQSEPETWTKYWPDVEELALNLGPLSTSGQFMTDLLLRSTLLGQAPYTNPVTGTPVTLRTLGEMDLATWGARLLQPERMIVALVYPPGLDLSPLTLELGQWNPPAGPALAEITTPIPSRTLESLRPMPGIVPTLSLGAVGPAVREPELAAYLVATAVLGDPQTGLFSTLRGTGPTDAIQVDWELERHRGMSLATSQFHMDIDGDIFALYDRVVALIEGAQLTGLDATAVARAQGSLEVALSARRTDPVELLSWLTSWSVWESLTAGRRLDAKIAAVTPQEATAALRTFFALDRIAIVGMASNLPEAYYFPDASDPYWGTFHQRVQTHDDPIPPDQYDPNEGPAPTG